jgi:hypothetical protein
MSGITGSGCTNLQEHHSEKEKRNTELLLFALRREKMNSLNKGYRWADSYYVIAHFELKFVCRKNIGS